MATVYGGESPWLGSCGFEPNGGLLLAGQNEGPRDWGVTELHLKKNCQTEEVFVTATNVAVT
jgi:hypothetical protein